jgi:hypothetical protein
MTISGVEIAGIQDSIMLEPLVFPSALGILVHFVHLPVHDPGLLF